MRKRYSRSRSPQHRRSRKPRSPSRSRERKPARDRDHEYDILKIKKESDIKNHFVFKLKHLTEKEEIETLAVIKQKLTEYVGPVEHITRSRERGDRHTTLNLGFKYDIDAISYLEGGLTIKTSSQNIKLEPKPTEVFEMLMNKKFNKIGVQQKVQKRKHQQSSRRRRASESSQSESEKRWSSSSSERGRKKVSKVKKDQMKLQLFGVPMFANDYKIFSLINKLPEGPYFCLDARWKKMEGSNCEYFQFYMNFQKAKKLLHYADKLQIEERPLLLVEAQSSNQLVKYQVKITFPKLVHPYTLLKNLNARIVQVLAGDKPQSDGRCRSFHLTLSDLQQVYHLKKVGRLQSGITVEEPRDPVLVYRPAGPWLLPPRSQLT